MAASASDVAICTFWAIASSDSFATGPDASRFGLAAEAGLAPVSGEPDLAFWADVDLSSPQPARIVHPKITQTVILALRICILFIQASIHRMEKSMLSD